jgi:ABC-type polysaccharide/polyol phosphate transport system ATPase subunit
MAVVAFEKVSKRFALHRDRPRSVQETLLSVFKGNVRQAPEEFWALREVDFEILPGQAVGFVGPNGAGKSTVLKLISRIIEPTSGRVEVHGKVGALLELGAGFHPDLTGRENIYLNGSILGLSRHQINSRLDEIIAFAELERFIDVPVRHYSSGMYVRLGFSVAVHTDPNLLLVDEVLAVGDESFRHKCLERIKQMQRQGVSIVLVSHSMEQIVDICNYALWLEDGYVRSRGIPEKVISDYLAASAADEQSQRTLRLLARRLASARVSEDSPLGSAQQDRWGDGRILIKNVRLLGSDGRAASVFSSDGPMRIEIEYVSSQALDEPPTFGIAIHRLDGVWCYGTNTSLDGVTLFAEQALQIGTIVVELPVLQLLRGDYTLDVAVHNDEGDVMYDYIQGVLHFQVQDLRGDQGVFRPRIKWSFRAN